MPKSCRLLSLGGLAASALIATAPTVAAGQGAGPCARAKALYQAGYYTEAEQAYKQLLGRHSCATTAVAQAREAAEHKAEIGQGSKELLAQARSLQGAGFEGDARKLVKEVAQKPGTSIPAELRALDQRVGWWREGLGLIVPVLRLVLEILIALAGVAVVALLAITGVRALYSRTRRSARLAGFSGSSEDTLAPVLGAALNEMLTRMGNQEPGRRVDLQSGTETKFELPDEVTKAVPQAGLLVGLVQMLDSLLYRKRVIVSGTVHPVHKNGGAGVTLVLANRRGATLRQMTIWEQEFMLKEVGEEATDAVRYERLILPLAVWLGYCKEMGFKSSKPPLDTHSWRSYALFALGEQVPDTVKKRQLYERALDLDEHNLGARLNLASRLLQRPTYEVPPQSGGQLVAEGSREGWEDCLDMASAHLEIVAKSACQMRDSIWYRALYMQTVVCIYRQDSAGARKFLSRLDGEISAHDKEEFLRGLVDEMSEAIAVLEKTVKLIEGTPVDEPDEPKGGWRSVTAEYNLACFWARWANAAQSDLKARELRTVEAVRLLRRASGRNERAIAEARVDPAFDSIRGNMGFQTVVLQSAEPAKADKPLRYAITMDPGPELLGLVKR